MLVIRESYAPFILQRRANALSRMTGSVYVSRIDAGKPPKTISQELSVSLVRPWILLFREPIVLLASLYTSINFGVLYMFFAAIPIVFQGARGWSQGIAGLLFVGVATGVCFATLGAGVCNKRYQRLCMTAETNGCAVEPEARLDAANYPTDWPVPVCVDDVSFGALDRAHYRRHTLLVWARHGLHLPSGVSGRFLYVLNHESWSETQKLTCM
jgi:hypothetical protein